jgi:hypothetical protein
MVELWSQIVQHVPGRCNLPDGLPHAFSAAPRWSRITAGVVVEPNRTGRFRLCEQDYLTSVHAEVLDDVIDRSEDGGLTTLNRTRPKQVGLGQAGHYSVRLANSSFETLEQRGRVGSVTSCKLRGTIALERKTANTAHNPLPYVPREVKQKIGDAV